MIVSVKSGHEDRYFEGNREYVVYAIYVGDKTALMLQSESFPSAPSSIALENVNVIDGRFSRYWVWGKPHIRIGGSKIADAVLSFPEWANDVGFFGDLIEGRGDAGKNWRWYRERMALEFAAPSISATGIQLEDGWVQCQECLDAWQAGMHDEVAICIHCHKRQRNPYLFNSR